MARVILITGGARSGKSFFAEEICKASGKKVGYIATSEALDEEMKLRVEKHRHRRPPGWKVWETPGGDSKILSDAKAQSEILLFDCVTLYLTYWMFHSKCPKEAKEREDFLVGKIKNLLAEFENWDGTILFVSNEVGMGIVPENDLAREFRDLAGKANELIANQSEETFLVVYGEAIPTKKLSVTPEEVAKEW